MVGNYQHVTDMYHFTFTLIQFKCRSVALRVFEHADKLRQPSGCKGKQAYQL